MNKPLSLLCILTLTFSLLWGQNEKVTSYVRCSAVEQQETLRTLYPNMQSNEDFERWIAEKIEERKNDPNAARRATYRVPYIVHVVHAGEPEGTGDNLSQAIVDAQMQQVNDDFNRTNSDTTNTPADFLPVASGLDIEFVPAVVDPDGNILDQAGIDRINGLADYGISSWGTGDIDGTLKPATSWDPNLVFNIWVCNLGGGLLGYAQFPEAPTLPGIGTGNGPSETDGIVVLSGAIGSLDMPGTSTPYHLGRTLTHELGHWAGLRHIWGDAGCGGDDFCDDTPTAGGSNFSGLPCTYPGPNSCTDPGTDFPDMFQNFMDYSDDACMNIFTVDQADRMIIVFENSPYRDTLNESPLWIFPSADTIIAKITKDAASGCSPVTVNFLDDSYVGDSAVAISSWTWNFDVGGLGGATPATGSGPMPAAVTFTNVGTYQISLTIDNGVYTSTATTTVVVEGTVPLNVMTGFQTGIPAGWSNDSWIESSTVGFNSTASIYQDNFSNSSRTSAYISTPSIDMDVMVTRIELTFDVAHANYGGTTFGVDEGLAIEVSTDCGNTWTEIWKQLDSDPVPFYTSQSTTNGWIPDPNEWRSELVDLTAYMGNPAVRVRFHGISDYGNDTYIDNILIETTTVSPSTVDAEFTASGSLVCEGQDVTFTDASTLGSGINDAVYMWNFDLNGTGTATPSTFTGQVPPAVQFGSSGTYTIELNVSSASAGNDDTYTLDVEVTGSGMLPYAEDFESGVFPPADLMADMGWLTSAGFDGSTYGAVADNFNEQDLVANLTLPSLDFSAVGQATLSFDLSHTYFAGLFGNFYDTLQISYSLDCGSTWTELWRKDDGDPLNPLYTVDPTGGEFAPTSNADWRNEEVDVTFLKGNNNVKIRFENRGGFGNQLYLDNINVDADLVPPNEVYAYFVPDALGGCVGSAVTFEDQSTAGANTMITTWDWNFDANGTGMATPATFSGQTPPAISFDQPGTYDVQLTVGDGTVTDVYDFQIAIEVPQDLTYLQDFSAAAFPPMGWTNVLWGQALESSDPLLGSMFADNYVVVDLQSYITTPSFDLSWYDEVNLQFDVSHARFSANENEGLVISSSLDCGQTFTPVWSKYDFDAAPLYTTSAFETSPYFPGSAADWREENIDLTSLNNEASVKLELYNDGAYGNNTFVDDIVMEGTLYAPTNLTANASGLDIELNWTDVSNKESNYDVLRLDTATNMYAVIATLGANTTTYTDMGLSTSTAYTYQVCAYNIKIQACSNDATDTTTNALTIGGLIAEVSTNAGTSIELMWDDLASNEDGFLIKRSEDNFQTYTVINVLTPNQEYYIDEFLDETVTYTYQVCAFNGMDTVGTNMDDATTELLAPTALVTIGVNNNVAISWTDNSLAEDGYNVKRSLNPGGPYSIVATVGTNVTDFTDFDLTELTEFCYVVCAYNAVTEASSAEECATTDIASSIFDELAQAITIYPNPANEFVELQLSAIKDDVQIKVYNQIGDLMITQNANGGNVTRLDVKNLASGIYMIRIQTIEGYTTKKLVVE